MTARVERITDARERRGRARHGERARAVIEFFPRSIARSNARAVDASRTPTRSSSFAAFAVAPRDDRSTTARAELDLERVHGGDG